MPASVTGYFVMFPRTKIESSDISSFYLPIAEGWVQSQLTPAFTLPFTSNNITFEQLTYYKIQHMVLLRSRDPDDSEEIGQELDEWVDKLVAGSSAMILTNNNGNETIYAGNVNASTGEIISSNTAGYTPAFDVDNSFAQTVDPDRLRDIESERR